MDFQLTIPSLASECYPDSAQALITEAFSKTRGQLDDITGVIISASAPAVDDRDKMWVRVDANGRPNGQFIYAGGQWTWKNEEEDKGNARRLFVGTTAQVWSYDGGDGSDPATTTPTATTGAMWEVDTLFAGRIPMGPGTIPDSDPAKVLAVNETYGSGVHTQAADEVAPHTHPLTADSSIVNGNNIKVVASGSGGSGLQIGGSGSPSSDLQVQANEYTGAAQEAMNIVPPVYGTYVIKRTGRTHYVA